MNGVLNWFKELFAYTLTEVTYEQLHAIAHSDVERLLPPDFEAVGDCRWVRNTNAPIRQIFTLTKFGGTLKPTWGVSLDFVPHLSGKQIKWHRSNKTAKLDLYFDPHDKTLELSYINGLKPIRRQLGWVVPKAVKRAKDFWKRCATVDDLPDALEWLRAYYAAGNGLTFYSYSQHFLTAAFIYKGIGRQNDAEAELDRTYPAFYEPEAWQKLKALIAA